MSNPLAEFAVYIQDKFSLFISEVQRECKISAATMRDILARNDIQDLLACKAPEAKMASKQVESESDNDTCDDGCKAELKTGERKGESCGRTVSKKSATRKYCGAHVRLETTGAVREKQGEDLDGVVFRLNRWNNFTFGETGLILKSGTEKKIIGKQLSDGSVVDLSDDDISLCKRRKIKFVRNYSKKDAAVGAEVKGSSTIEHTSKIPL